MANFIIKFKGTVNIQSSGVEPAEQITLGADSSCWIYGKKGTFNVIRQGEDVIASIGYVCFMDGKSSQETLLQILKSFQESQIKELKKQLVGQYLLLIRKDGRLYVFSDLFGGRNVFYSDSGMLISSSFSRAEDLLKTSPNDLDTYKVLEFLAVKHVLYPAWFGRSTEHKDIKWLLPYEYLVVDLAASSFRLGSVSYSLDNRKQPDLSALSSDLLSKLRAIIGRPEFRDSAVAASLSGGRDSRLVAAVASEFYSKIHYRTAYEPGHYDSSKDLKVARKLARGQGIPLDVYRFQQDQGEHRFVELTEGFSPTFNSKLAPLLDDVGAYSLGFGGIFGTELFMPIPWNSIDEFVEAKTALAKQFLKLEGAFWEAFRTSFYEELRGIKDHFELSEVNDQDYIRLFNLLNTARYGSYIISAFNYSGLQLEPYGSYSILDIALRVPSSLWGNHRRFGGDAKVQQAALAKLNSRMARVLTYKNYRPMMPLSVFSFPRYLGGVILQAGDVLRRKLDKSSKELRKVELPGGYYLSNGWEENFLDRTQKKYGLP